MLDKLKAVQNLLRFKPVDSKVLEHSIERRGFISVPFDYAKPKADRIVVFYRLIPAYGSTHGYRSKLIVVVRNGGPGISSSIYRSLNFDYTNPESPANGSLDRFKYSLKTHRILLVDQRGTDGQSAPLDFGFPGGQDSDWVATYFSSDSQACDYAAVIEEVVPEGYPFFLIGQSYGGMPAMQYISLEDARRPNGIVFSSSGLPHEDSQDQLLSRRREQLQLNLKLREMVPDITLRLENVKAHLGHIGADPMRIHGLYTFLGKDVAGKWEKDFVHRLEKIKQYTFEEFESDLATQLGGVMLLNYILSSANFTPGYADRSFAQLSSDKIPFEPWMIDENQLYISAGQDATQRASYIDAIDRKPPPATPFASLKELRASIGCNQLLFTAADNDAYVPADSYLRSIDKFQVPGHTEVKKLPGGHHAIFFEKGHNVFLEWSRERM